MEKFGARLIELLLEVLNRLKLPVRKRPKNHPSLRQAWGNKWGKKPELSDRLNGFVS